MITLKYITTVVIHSRRRPTLIFPKNVSVGHAIYVALHEVDVDIARWWFQGHAWEKPQVSMYTHVESLKLMGIIK